MRKYVIGGVVMLALVVSMSSCAKKYSSERDGKKLGEAICDLRDATSQDEVDEALDDIDNQVGDLARKNTIFTAQDQRAVDENLADLAEHAAQGNTELLQQDLAVIQRNRQQARSDLNDSDRAALDGIQQGLADCTE